MMYGLHHCTIILSLGSYIFHFATAFYFIFLVFLHNNEMNVCDEFIAVFMPCLCTCGGIVRIGKSNRFGRGGLDKLYKGGIVVLGVYCCLQTEGVKLFPHYDFNLFLA